MWSPPHSSSPSKPRNLIRRIKEIVPLPPSPLSIPSFASFRECRRKETHPSYAQGFLFPFGFPSAFGDFPSWGNDGGGGVLVIRRRPSLSPLAPKIDPPCNLESCPNTPHLCNGEGEGKRKEWFFIPLSPFLLPRPMSD